MPTDSAAPVDVAEMHQLAFTLKVHRVVVDQIAAMLRVRVPSCGNPPIDQGDRP